LDSGQVGIQSTEFREIAGEDVKKDKRHHKRYPVNQFITAKFSGEPESKECLAMNLNRTGVCVCGLVPFSQNGEVELTFHFRQDKDGETVERIPGVVKWAVQLGIFHTAGIQFAFPLNEEDHFLTVALIELAKDFDTG
jgi:hypothetical protein